MPSIPLPLRYRDDYITADVTYTGRGSNVTVLFVRDEDGRDITHHLTWSDIHDLERECMYDALAESGGL